MTADDRDDNRPEDAPREPAPFGTKPPVDEAAPDHQLRYEQGAPDLQAVLDAATADIAAWGEGEAVDAELYRPILPPEGPSTREQRAAERRFIPAAPNVTARSDTPALASPDVVVPVAPADEHPDHLEPDQPHLGAHEVDEDWGPPTEAISALDLAGEPAVSPDEIDWSSPPEAAFHNASLSDLLHEVGGAESNAASSPEGAGPLGLDPSGGSGGDTPVGGAPAAAAGGRRRRRRKPAKPRSALRGALEWVAVVGGALLVAVLLQAFIVKAYYIPTGSMESTLVKDDRVLVNKLSYRLHGVNRGDVIVFERPDEPQVEVQTCDGGTITIAGDSTDPSINDLIKRVVALGGEQVEQRDGRLYVDGQLLEEPYVNGGSPTPPFSFSSQCIIVPEGRVFVLGDNRGFSAASNVFGPIREDTIVGRAFVRVWPLGSIGGL